jgi:hypothetical protein
MQCHPVGNTTGRGARSDQAGARRRSGVRGEFVGRRGRRARMRVMRRALAMETPAPSFTAAVACFTTAARRGAR